MDTWSTAQFAVDVLFAALLAGTIALFLYRRERKLKKQLAGVLSQVSTVAPNEASNKESAAVPDVGHEPRLSRAEKYLEAVRMYRSGKDRKEIERRLGISLVELELLGRAR